MEYHFFTPSGEIVTTDKTRIVELLSEGWSWFAITPSGAVAG